MIIKYLHFAHAEYITKSFQNCEYIQMLSEGPKSVFFLPIDGQN